MQNYSQLETTDEQKTMGKWRYWTVLNIDYFTKQV